MGIHFLNNTKCMVMIENSDLGLTKFVCMIYIEYKRSLVCFCVFVPYNSVYDNVLTFQQSVNKVGE